MFDDHAHQKENARRDDGDHEDYRDEFDRLVERSIPFGRIAPIFELSFADEEGGVVPDLGVLLEERRQQRIGGEVVGTIEQRGIDPQDLAYRRWMLVEDLLQTLPCLPCVWPLAQVSSDRRN